VTKYCNEQVSVCVCLSVRERISQTTRARSSIFLVHVAYGRDSVLLSGGITKFLGEGAILGVFFPLTMHCTA